MEIDGDLWKILHPSLFLGHPSQSRRYSMRKIKYIKSEIDEIKKRIIQTKNEAKMLCQYMKVEHELH